MTESESLSSGKPASGAEVIPVTPLATQDTRLVSAMRMR